MKISPLDAELSIYLITDGTTNIANFAEKKEDILHLVKIAVETKVSLIQIREKLLPARYVFELAVEVCKLTKNTGTKILVNDRADIALAANTDGVHLTAASLSAAIIRQHFPANFIVGVSAHTLEKAEAAKMQGANFVTFSPIYQSPDKGAPQGIEKLKEVCQWLKPFPVIALGGIDETNFAEVLETGASGFAAIRFLNDEGNLKKLNENFAAKNYK
ncbi:MAG: thiamine phosphate synthase [Pyrinomonadaceae bacterium]|nr:thiamine phosphate synthase [Pyrinomonadaceae bacterium]